MSDYAFKVSQPGVNVGTATDPRDFIFNSGFLATKVVQSGLGTIVVNASATAVGTVAHNLGYNPLAMFFIELTPDSGRYYNGVSYPAPIDSSAVTINGVENGTHVDNNNLYLTVVNGPGSQKSVKFRYFIFGDYS